MIEYCLKELSSPAVAPWKIYISAVLWERIRNHLQRKSKRLGDGYLASSVLSFIPKLKPTEASSPSSYTYPLMVALKPRSQTRSAPKPTGSPWTTRTSRGLQLLQIPAFSKLPWLIHGFSTKPGGVSDQNGERVLNLGFTEWDTKDNVLENRRRFQSVLGATDLQLVSLKQIHSDVIHLFDSVPAEACRGDASVTNRPGLLLGVQTADCVPILLVDAKKRAIASIHAGWR